MGVNEIGSYQEGEVGNPASENVENCLDQKKESGFGDPSYRGVGIRRSLLQESRDSEILLQKSRDSEILLQKSRDSEIPPTGESGFGDPSYRRVGIRRSSYRRVGIRRSLLQAGLFSFRFRSWFSFTDVKVFAQYREHSSLLQRKNVHAYKVNM